ncbi:hypothetical protein BURPS668_3496 [Burkholderia pseudomallei 668]|nr:hypothetical protein BURPS668_3496 [Burkholderia pseudomallei 668]
MQSSCMDSVQRAASEYKNKAAAKEIFLSVIVLSKGIAF